MRLPIDEGAMLCWLASQVRVVEAWREVLASRPEADLDMITTVEAHYQFLTKQIYELDRRFSQAA